MWLDRFSGQSTPSGSPPPPQTRGYSPAPLRRSNLGPGLQASRPSFSARSSSLSLAATLNASTTSLPSTSRQPNGSGLKHQITRSPPPDIPDPLEVLSSILATHLGDNKEDPNGAKLLSSRKPRALTREIEFNGLSLQGFAAQEAPQPDSLNGKGGSEIYGTDQCAYVMCQTLSND